MKSFTRLFMFVGMLGMLASPLLAENRSKSGLDEIVGGAASTARIRRLSESAMIRLPARSYCMAEANRPDAVAGPPSPTTPLVAFAMVLARCVTVPSGFRR